MKVSQKQNFKTLSNAPLKNMGILASVILKKKKKNIWQLFTELSPGPSNSS